MRKYIRNVLLWLFGLDLGISLGAGIYEGRIVVPEWENTPPQAWPNTGLKFWAFVTTGPLSLLTLASLVAAWREQGPRRYWWLGAVAITIAERSATFSYFIPTIMRLMGTEDLPEAEVKATLSQWRRLNYGRHVLTLGAWLAALKALSSPSR
jgi:anthrone oxygenase-like protein